MHIDMVGDYRHFFRPELMEEEDMVVRIYPAKKGDCFGSNVIEVSHIYLTISEDILKISL
jgi:hypothetical protein